MSEPSGRAAAVPPSVEASSSTTSISCSFAAALSSWQGELSLQLSAGSSVADALAAALAKIEAEGVRLEAQEREEWSGAPVGIFGEACSRDRRVESGDRVELYQPLRVDPKAARRARAQQTQTEKGRNPLTVKPTRQG